MPPSYTVQFERSGHDYDSDMPISGGGAGLLLAIGLVAVMVAKPEWSYVAFAVAGGVVILLALSGVISF